MKTRLLVWSLVWMPLLTALAQVAPTAQPTELDAVIKELETNGYEAVKNKKLNLRAIHYVSGTSRLTPEDRQYLDTISVFLTRVPTVVMEIGGHTDNVGDRTANTRLSQERAASAMQYVISRGVLARRIKAVGYGSAQPIAENRTDAGRAENRRVEIRFLGLTSDVYNIVTKSGRKLPATYVVVSADGRSVSYRENAGSPLTRVPTSGIDFIEYPDGSRRRPDAIVLMGSGDDTSRSTKVAEPAPTVTTYRTTQPGAYQASNAKSIIKYAPLSSFGYEHVLANNRSIYGGISLYSLGFGVSALGIKGEYRFYGLINSSPKQAPEGFWVAPTVLLWRVSSNDFYGETESVTVAQVGGIAGYQWIFNNKISLEPALGLSLTAIGSGSDSSLGAGLVPLFALRVGYVLK